ncbi:transporter substrate-binding domain-containing protein [Clostridiisalibacter paucivorans]|uniref:transporter substrate-binding domain-containing protein n=1 Tax=Clostridiisalibacter paucivorans TaxID=408753 RepID=UPI00047A867F|nr:transporter substrate-binding domain-containing protein [Clostridiisalibacter paucivorans]
MKKRAAIYLLILFLIMIVLFNQLTKIKYDLNLYEYYIQSKPITENEFKIIEDRGTIIFTSDENAPPLSYIEEENNQYRGLVIDYASALSVEMGADIIFKPSVWENALNGLKNGEADIVDIFVSDERKLAYSFSKPIYQLKGVVLVASKNNSIEEISDLFGHTVAIQRGDYAREHIDKHFPQINYILTDDIEESIFLLRKGIVNGVIGDEPVINYFVLKMNLKDETHLIYPYIYEQDVVLAVRKADSHLLNIFNKAILNLKKIDYVTKIQQRWFGISTPIEKTILTDNMFIGGILFIVIVAAIVLVMLILIEILKEEISSRNSEIRKSKEELETTFNALNQLVVVLDEYGIILNCNKPFLKLIGSDKSKVIGTHYLTFPILNLIEQEINTFFNKDNDIKNMEIPMDNRTYSFSVFSMDFVTDNTYKLLIVIEDITDFRIIEGRLAQRNKMEAIGQLAAGVAHEIRNPLGLIHTYGYLMKENNLNQEDIKSLEIIEESVGRIDHIITNLLNFSRLTDDYEQKIFIKDMIINIVELEQIQLEIGSIKFDVKCDELLTIHSNRESLKHILINTIENAIHAIEQDGVIEIICYPKDNGVNIIIKDNGIGINEENLKNIFNPFFTTKQNKDGTGLGLYVVYNEVQKLGGEIQVESSIGLGTTFTIYLPERMKIDG